MVRTDLVPYDKHHNLAALVQFPFSKLSVNCDSYKVAIIWAIITIEFDGSLHRNLGSWRE